MKTKIAVLLLAAMTMGGCGQKDPKVFEENLRDVCRSLEVECLQIEAMFKWMNQMGEMSGFNDTKGKDGKETMRSLVMASRKRLAPKLAALKPAPVEKQPAVDLANQLFRDAEAAGNSMDFSGPATENRKAAATMAVKTMRATKTALSHAAPPGCIEP
jgi:hypothetical protein